MPLFSSGSTASDLQSIQVCVCSLVLFMFVCMFVCMCMCMFVFVFMCTQPAEIEYVPCDKAYVSALRDRIERTLMEKFAHEWRTGYGIAGITHWNRGCVQDLRKLLVQCVPV